MKHPAIQVSTRLHPLRHLPCPPRVTLSPSGGSRRGEKDIKLTQKLA
jgi:hypothetical protein